MTIALKLKQLITLYIPTNTISRIAGSIFWVGIIGEFATLHTLTIWTGLQISGIAMLGFIFLWKKKGDK